MTISGAERGDKFTLVIKADNAELTVEVTVGADDSPTLKMLLTTTLTN